MKLFLFTFVICFKAINGYSREASRNYPNEDNSLIKHRLLDLSGTADNLEYTVHTYKFKRSQNWEQYTKDLIKSGKSDVLKDINGKEINILLSPEILHELDGLALHQIEFKLSGSKLFQDVKSNWKILPLGKYMSNFLLPKHLVLMSEKDGMKIQVKIGSDVRMMNKVASAFPIRERKDKGHFKLLNPSMSISSTSSTTNVKYNAFFYAAELGKKNLNSNDQNLLDKIQKRISEDTIQRINRLKPEELLGLEYEYLSKTESLPLGVTYVNYFIEQFVDIIGPKTAFVDLDAVVRRFLKEQELLKLNEKANEIDGIDLYTSSKERLKRGALDFSKSLRRRLLSVPDQQLKQEQDKTIKRLLEILGKVGLNSVNVPKVETFMKNSVHRMNADHHRSSNKKFPLKQPNYHVTLFKNSRHKKVGDSIKGLSSLDNTYSRGRSPTSKKDKSKQFTTENSKPASSHDVASDCAPDVTTEKLQTAEPVTDAVTDKNRQENPDSPPSDSKKEDIETSTQPSSMNWTPKQSNTEVETDDCDENEMGPENQSPESSNNELNTPSGVKADYPKTPQDITTVPADNENEMGPENQSPESSNNELNTPSGVKADYPKTPQDITTVPVDNENTEKAETQKDQVTETNPKATENVYTPDCEDVSDSSTEQLQTENFGTKTSATETPIHDTKGPASEESNEKPPEDSGTGGSPEVSTEKSRQESPIASTNLEVTSPRAPNSVTDNPVDESKQPMDGVTETNGKTPENNDYECEEDDSDIGNSEEKQTVATGNEEIMPPETENTVQTAKPTTDEAIDGTLPQSQDDYGEDDCPDDDSVTENRVPTEATTRKGTEKYRRDPEPGDSSEADLITENPVDTAEPNKVTEKIPGGTESDSEGDTDECTEDSVTTGKVFYRRAHVPAELDSNIEDKKMLENAQPLRSNGLMHDDAVEYIVI